MANKKIHRRFIPSYNGYIPNGISKILFNYIKIHDWNKNNDLIKLRQKGYTPYKKINDKNFVPKPMRSTVRKESKQALTTLLITLICNCSFNLNNKYLFEIYLSIEKIAELMGTLYIYKNGRKSYDITLHALRVFEELEYILIHRSIDFDSGQWKPMRIFLTDKLFEGLFLNINKIKRWLIIHNNKYCKNDVYKKNTLYKLYIKKNKRLQIYIKNYPLILNKLLIIKNKFIDLIENLIFFKNKKKNKKKKIDIINIKKKKKYIINNNINYKKQNINDNNIIKKKINNIYEYKWYKWYKSKEYMPIHSLLIDNLINKKYPNLFNINKNKYYKLFCKNLL